MSRSFLTRNISIWMVVVTSRIPDIGPYRIQRLLLLIHCTHKELQCGVRYEISEYSIVQLRLSLRSLLVVTALSLGTTLPLPAMNAASFWQDGAKPHTTAISSRHYEPVSCVLWRRALRPLTSPEPNCCDYLVKSLCLAKHHAMKMYWGKGGCFRKIDDSRIENCHSIADWMYLFSNSEQRLGLFRCCTPWSKR
jgi:hypothetical protein